MSKTIQEKKDLIRKFCEEQGNVEPYFRDMPRLKSVSLRFKDSGEIRPKSYGLPLDRDWMPFDDLMVCLKQIIQDYAPEK